MKASAKRGSIKFKVVLEVLSATIADPHADSCADSGLVFFLILALLAVDCFRVIHRPEYRSGFGPGCGPAGGTVVSVMPLCSSAESTLRTVFSLTPISLAMALAETLAILLASASRSRQNQTSLPVLVWKGGWRNISVFIEILAMVRFYMAF